MNDQIIHVIRQETKISIHPEASVIHVLPNSVLNSANVGIDDQWQVITANTQLVAGAYAVDSLTLTSLTLPATAVLSQTIKIYGLGNGGWRLTQNEGQFIRGGDKVTTTGLSGSIYSSKQGDYLELLYLNSWVCTEIFGNLLFS